MWLDGQALLKTLTVIVMIKRSSVGTAGDTGYIHSLASEAGGTSNVLPRKMGNKPEITEITTKSWSKTVIFLKGRFSGISFNGDCQPKNMIFKVLYDIFHRVCPPAVHPRTEGGA